MRSLYSVAEIQALRVFRSECEIIADSEALARTVSWAMRIVPQDLDQRFINGGEFFFISSEHFNNRWPDKKVISSLVASNASGLCIENGIIYHQLSEEGRKLAEEMHFPIIIVNKVLNSSSLITEINQEILGSRGDEAQREQAETYYRKLKEMELGSDIIDFLQYTAGFLNVNCGYWHILSEPLCTGPEDIRATLGDRREELMELDEKEVWQNDRAAFCSIQVLSEPYAFVYLLKDRELNDFDLLILKRLTAFLRTRVVSRFISRLQQQHSRDSQWVRFWLEGKLSYRLILDHLRKSGIEKTEGFVVGVVPLPRGRSYSYDYRRSYEEDHRIVSDAILQASILMFRAFRAQGFTSLQHIESGEKSLLWHIYIAPEGMTDWKERYQKAVDSLNENVEFLKDDPDLHMSLAACTKRSEVPLAAANAQYCRDLSLDVKKKAIAYEDLHLLKAAKP